MREALTFHHGELDGLIIAHGIVSQGTIRETNMKDWDKIMAVNARSVFAMASLCVSFLKEKQGCITILSGSAGMTPSPNYAVFSISKAIINRFIECAALELAYHKV